MDCSRTKAPFVAELQAVLVSIKSLFTAGVLSVLLDSILKKEPSCGLLQLP